MIFVDTGAWFASIVRGDANHSVAAAWFAQNQEPLLTTDDVLSETLTLLVMRGQRRAAEAFGAAIFGGRLATLHTVTRDETLAAWQTFLRYSDKQWSFTDCSSKVVIEKLGISTAVSFDHHFLQFGSVIVVP